jgi:DMSO/TMAO reductase YedYZ molybdopterin-dependent catalytic subunit
MNETREPDPLRSIARREFLMRAASGTVITALGGGLYMLSDALTREAKAQTRDDGRPRVPPGQRVIQALKPMGGDPGDPSRANFSLKVHGEVERPLALDFAALMALGATTVRSDVHCVTGWSCLDAKWTGVTLKTIAAAAGVKDTARHVIFESAHGYTANVRLREVIDQDDVMVAWDLDGQPLRRPHGAPVRAVVPDLYFWKSAKWLTGIRFVQRDQPGYWETRGYHNHADPWKEERYG